MSLFYDQRVYIEHPNGFTEKRRCIAYYGMLYQIREVINKQDGNVFSNNLHPQHPHIRTAATHTHDTYVSFVDHELLLNMNATQVYSIQTESMTFWRVQYFTLVVDSFKCVS